jgi:hypothetical protein
MDSVCCNKCGGDILIGPALCVGCTASLRAECDALRLIVTKFVRNTEGIVAEWNERHPTVQHPLTATVNEGKAALRKEVTP